MKTPSPPPHRSIAGGPEGRVQVGVPPLPGDVLAGHLAKLAQGLHQRAVALLGRLRAGLEGPQDPGLLHLALDEPPGCQEGNEREPLANARVG